MCMIDRALCVNVCRCVCMADAWLSVRVDVGGRVHYWVRRCVCVCERCVSVRIDVYGCLIYVLIYVLWNICGYAMYIVHVYTGARYVGASGLLVDVGGYVCVCVYRYVCVCVWVCIYVGMRVVTIALL